MSTQPESWTEGHWDTSSEFFAMLMRLPHLLSSCHEPGSPRGSQRREETLYSVLSGVQCWLREGTWIWNVEGETSDKV